MAEQRIRSTIPANANRKEIGRTLPYQASDFTSSKKHKYENDLAISERETFAGECGISVKREHPIIMRSATSFPLLDKFYVAHCNRLIDLKEPTQRLPRLIELVRRSV